MNNSPRLREVILSGFASIICAVVMLLPLPEWGRMAALLLGILFLSIGLVTAAYLIVFTHADAIRALGMAKVEPPVTLARALHDLSAQALDIVDRHDVIKIRMMIQEDGAPVYGVDTGGGFVPKGFIQEFLRASVGTSPYLWPISRAEEIVNDKGEPWPNAERMAAALTNHILTMKWATDAIGNQSARLTRHIQAVAARYDVRL